MMASTERTSEPLVSVVLPTYERLPLLRATVDTVFRQTLREWELIVADDGSGSDVLAYLDELARDARVQVLRLAHSGKPGSVRNAALQRARAPWIAFLDSDDLWAPRKLERQLARLQRAPDCQWSYTAFTIVDAEGVVLPSERTRPWTPFGGQIFEQVVRSTASIRVPAVIAAGRLLRDAGEFDETLDCGEDYDLWMRLALRSAVCVVDEPLVLVRRHAGNQPRAAGHAHRARDYSLRKLAARVGAAQRALLAEERSRNALACAAELAASGGRWRSLAAVADGLPLGWRYPRWWYGAARACARACIGPRRSASV
jgi:glycosyltransferase involved in cell wall biosynthesis